MGSWSCVMPALQARTKPGLSLLWLWCHVLMGLWHVAFYINASTLLCASPLVWALPTDCIWAMLITSSLFSEHTMHSCDKQTVLDSENCAHMLFEENLNEHGWDAYMDKMQESDAFLHTSNCTLHPNALLLHYLSFVAFWLQSENRPFVTRNLFRI